MAATELLQISIFNLKKKTNAVDSCAIIFKRASIIKAVSHLSPLLHQEKGAVRHSHYVIPVRRGELRPGSCSIRALRRHRVVNIGISKNSLVPNQKENVAISIIRVDKI